MSSLPPILTRYEMARVVGLRALQIEEGAHPFVSCNEGEQSIHIAARELSARKLDVLLKRDDESYVSTLTCRFPRDLSVMTKSANEGRRLLHRP